MEILILRLVSIARVASGEAYKIGIWHMSGDEVVPYTGSADKEDDRSGLSPYLQNGRHCLPKKDGRNDRTRAGQWAVAERPADGSRG
jgi:hypothetical protein